MNQMNTSLNLKTHVMPYDSRQHECEFVSTEGYLQMNGSYFNTWENVWKIGRKADQKSK